MRPRDSSSAAARAERRATPERWWGAFPFAAGEAGLWRLGPLTLGVERRASEWRVGWSRAARAVDAADDATRAAEAAAHSPLAPSELPPLAELARFAGASAAAALRVEPLLPERPVVAKPESPLALLPREQVALHVAIPVWLRLALDDGTPLVEVASERLRETWLGPSTTTGELCWLTPVPARLVRERLPAAPHLAAVTVTLTNRAAAPLVVERVSVPVQHVALWWHAEHGLLTGGVFVERDADGSMARLRIVDALPADGAEPVTAARQPEPRLGLVRALEALLG